MKRRRVAKLRRPATEIQLRVETKPGSVSPARRQAWQRLWTKLIAGAKSEVAK